VRGGEGVVGPLQVPYCLFPQVQGAMAYQRIPQTHGEHHPLLSTMFALAEPSAAVSAAAQEGAVTWTLVNKNNAALGFPARSEIMPGIHLSG
jgi:hypothetical protein